MNKENENNIKWVLVYTKPNQEDKAQLNLENQGFTTLLPKISFIKPDSKAFNKEVMFPRYLFLKIDQLDSKWHKINSTKGVSHLIYFGQTISEVPNYAVEEIRKKLDDNGVFNLKTYQREYIRGDKIFLKNGPLKGHEAIFLSRKSKNRVNILIKFINASQVADIASSEIRSKTISPTVKF